MSLAAVRPELIRWARERARLKPAKLMKRFPRLPMWESDTAKPTFRQLEAFAKATTTPLGYLFLSEPPDEPLTIPDLRTVEGALIERPSPDLLETIQTMQRRQDWMREFLAEEGHEPLPFVGSASKRDGPVELARKIRKELGFAVGWARGYRTWTEALRALRASVETAGIFLVVNGVVGNNTHRILNPGEFRGFVLVDGLAPLVFVNGADCKAAQMFTLAHELAHVWVGQPGVFNLPRLQPADLDVERFCNKVAAEFLIPEDELRDLWPAARKAEEPFQEIARNFKVSTLVAARRTLDLELISKKAFFDFYDKYQVDERRNAKKSTGGDFWATQELRLGRRFGMALVQAAREGRLLFRDAYELSGLHGKTFDRLAEKLGYRVVL